MTTETKLLPCPFCGSEARVNEYLRGDGDWEYRIDCPNISPHGKCNAIATTGFKSTLEKAIEAWNTRTPKIDISAEPVDVVNVEPDGWCAWHPEHGWFNDNICGVDVPDLYGSKADAMEVLGCTEVWTVRPVWLSTTAPKKEKKEEE